MKIKTADSLSISRPTFIDCISSAKRFVCVRDLCFPSRWGLSLLADKETEGQRGRNTCQLWSFTVSTWATGGRWKQSEGGRSAGGRAGRRQAIIQVLVAGPTSGSTGRERSGQGSCGRLSGPAPGKQSPRESQVPCDETLVRTARPGWKLALDVREV